MTFAKVLIQTASSGVACVLWNINDVRRSSYYQGVDNLSCQNWSRLFCHNDWQKVDHSCQISRNETERAVSIISNTLGYINGHKNISNIPECDIKESSFPSFVLFSLICYDINSTLQEHKKMPMIWWKMFPTNWTNILSTRNFNILMTSLSAWHVLSLVRFVIKYR